MPSVREIASWQPADDVAFGLLCILWFIEGANIQWRCRKQRGIYSRRITLTVEMIISYFMSSTVIDFSYILQYVMYVYGTTVYWNIYLAYSFSSTYSMCLQHVSTMQHHHHHLCSKEKRIKLCHLKNCKTLQHVTLCELVIIKAKPGGKTFWIKVVIY